MNLGLGEGASEQKSDECCLVNPVLAANSNDLMDGRMNFGEWRRISCTRVTIWAQCAARLDGIGEKYY
jgi:hypothetical protein